MFTLTSQKENSYRYPALKTYLEFIYNFFDVALEDKKRILEIGAGAGTSLTFLRNPNIKRTDLIQSDNPKILGQVDIHELPFKNGEFDFVFGMDVIHHLQFPTKALSEIQRVTENTEKGVVALFVEPYVSIFSFLPYRIFHEEKTTLRFFSKLEEPVVGDEPEDGDQTLPRYIFCSKNGKKLVEKSFPQNNYCVHIQYISILSFFLTGGINRPLRTPGKMISKVIQIEEKLSPRIMKLFASRMVIQIERTN